MIYIELEMRNALVIAWFAETVFEVVQFKNERYFCLENDFQNISSKFRDEERADKLITLIWETCLWKWHSSCLCNFKLISATGMENKAKHEEAINLQLFVEINKNSPHKVCLCYLGSYNKAWYLD